MKTLEKRCDRLVNAVKAYLSEQSVVFIHAFSSEKIQNPPDRYIVSVSYDEVSAQNFVTDRQGGIISADVLLCVYAPRRAAGEELYGICARLAQAVRSKGGGAVESVVIEKTRYDASARSVCRDIRARLSYPKGESDE